MNYKGMDKDMKCSGFQFEPGKEYETDEVKVCKKGFHACEYPLDVLRYYPPNTSRFFEVEQSGEIHKHSDDSKVASTKIKIGAELSISGLVKAAVNYTMERAKPENTEHATGYRGAASATGKDGVALAAGYECKAKGALGCAIFGIERGKWNGETYPILAVKAAIVDGVEIKADTYYTLKNGEFVQC